MFPKKIILILLILYSSACFSQVANPITVDVIMTPPHSAVLSEYSSLGSNKLIANVRFNDLSEPLWNARLRIIIESSQIRICTKLNYRPPTPIELLPGTVIQISGQDLEPYLNYANIEIQGMTMFELQRNGVIPEGFYTFSIEVYDYNSNRLLSNTASFSAMIQLNGVPLVQTPSTGGVIMQTNPLNIPFSWQLSSPSLYGDPSSIEYQLSLYKILDPNVNPVNAIINNVVEKIYESNFSNSTSLIYGINDPPLIIGEKYAFTIQAKDVDGRSVFKNDGFSEVGWFYYGYPGGGHIDINEPENRKSFTISEFKRFWWNNPDNVQNDQQVYYKLKIVELFEGQDSLEAINNNTIWYEHSTIPQIGSTGFDFTLPKPLEKLKKYAWQIMAFTGEQEIAKSEVYTFTGPPIIEKFMAGNHEFLVTKTSNNDLSNLSGSGKTIISETGNYLNFDFENISISNSGGENILNEGEMIADANQISPINIEPNYEDNGESTFYPETFKLNKNALSIKGSIIWPFPLATDQSNLAKIETLSGWMNFDSYKLLGSISLGNNNQFTLLDPIGYDIAFDSLSNILISDNNFTLRLFGNLSMPEEIVNIDKQRMVLPFRNINNLFYFTQRNVNCDKNIAIANNTKLEFRPLDYTLDFSEVQSIPEINDNPNWKGISITKHKVTIPENVDENSSLSLEYPLEYENNINENPNFKCWIDNTGLNITSESSFSSYNTGLYCSFNNVINNIKLKVENGTVTNDSKISGTTIISLINEDNPLAFDIPISNDGFSNLEFEEDLIGKKIILNEDKEKLKVEITIKQALFKNNEKLEFCIDLDWPFLQTYIPNVNDFCLWGNGDCGFGAPNKGKPITNHTEALYYNTYDMTVDSVLAGRHSSSYLFGVSGYISLGDDVAGSNNQPPRVYMASTEKKTGTNTSYDLSTMSWVQNYISEASLFSSPEDIYANLPYIRINSVAVEFEGGLVATHNHPVWGNAFYGLLDGKIKQPQEYAAKLQFLTGKEDGVSYWFGEIGLSTSGQEPENPEVPTGKKKKLKKVQMSKTGLKIGALEITGITGRVYHNMRPETAVGVDCNMDFSEISEPSIESHDIEIEIPELPEVDICEILNHLNVEQMKSLMCSLHSSAFNAVLEQFPEPDFDDIQTYMSQNGPSDSEFLNQMIAAEGRALAEQTYEEGGIQEKYHKFTYDRLAKVFPGYDWCQKVIDDNAEGMQWGDLLCQKPNFTFPTFPDLCELSGYLFDKVLEELPEPEYDDLEAIMNDEDWSLIKIEKPSISWPEIHEMFPNKDLCKFIMIWPGIDWGDIYFKIPSLPKLEWPDWSAFYPSIPDIELTLPDLDIDFSLPDMSFEPGEITVDYKVDPSVSYGIYVLVDYADFLKKGEVVEGTGTMEIKFTQSGGLEDIGLEVTSNWGNNPGQSPILEGLGCMTYTQPTKQFVGDFWAQSKGPAICGHGKLHVDINPNTWHVNLASKEAPVIVQPLCTAGPLRITGYFGLDPNRFTIGLGAYLCEGFSGSIGNDICDLGIDASMSLQADILATLQYRPEIKLEEAYFNVAFNAGLDVTTSGTACTFGDFEIARISLNGSLRYFERNIRGTVSGYARFLSIISCDFDLDTNFDI